MILDKFLVGSNLNKEQKKDILEAYGLFMEAYVENEKQFTRYTSKSVKRMFNQLHLLKSEELEKLGPEDLMVLAMSVKAILVRLKIQGVSPRVSQVNGNGENFDLGKR